MRTSVTEREALEEFWLRDLSHIRTYYGRLVYLAGLRNPDTGRYDYYGFAPDSSTTATVNRALKRTHESIFRDWVNYSLEQKKSDVDVYIASTGVEKPELIDAWLRLSPYMNLVPASIQGPERQKHMSDFEAILGLLKNVYGVSFRGQTA